MNLIKSHECLFKSRQCPLLSNEAVRVSKTGSDMALLAW